MRNRFDTQLMELNNELIAMGALCENAIARMDASAQIKNTTCMMFSRRLSQPLRCRVAESFIINTSLYTVGKGENPFRP